ncbi:Uncharacterized protein PECH_001845 [Penicillium ucsense]|uniref:Short-chain dehydrogenase/reductase n=1 Tax=Penicillium ucsense TaxID=2839758 RepID=A0A8J8VY48_9EURO|nr:Uncharacterized protein PECM_001978 [Penicillium ucsense]KAF7732224.1 Uncharacterized protein PECH_001845 [Penicillium ucsense]
MVTLQAVQAHNGALRSRATGLVAVFVGGTSGIALSTALAFTRHTTAPRIYLIGRSRSAADTAIASMKNINPSSQPFFLQSDISLLKNVDKACAEIAAREQKVNLLFMTPGVMTMKGRQETAEGLDRKFVLHYYARMRFIYNLLPLLREAARQRALSDGTRLSRVVSVFDPMVSIRAGGSGTLDFSDLSLKKTFSLQRCGAHASLMGNFLLECLAHLQPQTSFTHTYPSGVATGILREVPAGRFLSALMTPILKPFMVPLEESGERHLYAATSPRYPPKIEGMTPKEDACLGSDGTKGSGCYWVSWDGEEFPVNKKMEITRQQDAAERVLQHTEEVFNQICEQGKTYP